MSTTIELPAPEIEVATEREEYRRDVFLRAAEIMERDGYTTGTKGMATVGPVCLLGAVGRALGRPAITDSEVWIKYGQHGGGVKCTTSYDYVYTGLFVLDLDDSEQEDDDRIETIWSFSDQSSEERVLRTLYALANGKTFAEALRG